jgi:chitin synthase
MCPAQQVLSKFELTDRTSLSDPWVSAYGRVYQISDVLATHKAGYGIQEFQFSPLLGTDVSELFYKVPSFSYYCPDLPAPAATWDDLLDRRPPSSTYFPHRAVDPTTGTPKYYLEYLNRFARYRLAWDLPYLAKTASVQKKLIAIFDNVYDGRC